MLKDSLTNPRVPSYPPPLQMVQGSIAVRCVDKPHETNIQKQQRKQDKGYKVGPVTSYKWSYEAPISRVTTPVTQFFSAIYRLCKLPCISSKG